MTARSQRRRTVWPSYQSVVDFDVAEDLAWQAYALCAETDPEAFYPEKGEPAAPAKKVCMACPVRTDCLEYALDNDEAWGIWGGLSIRQRRKLKRQEVAA